jgi:hypothetical protein
VGALTNRDRVTSPAQRQVIAGALHTGAVGTAFLGPSPDGTCKAVFCVVTADGALVQEHTLKGLDGLVPAGTVEPLLGQSWEAPHQDVEPRLGVLMNPYTRAPVVLQLFVSEPFDDTITVIDLGVTGPLGNEVFAPTAVRTMSSEALNGPVDLAPAAIETANLQWASNTTLEEGADFYVANRGDNTIVRMRQNGTVVAVVRVRIDGEALGDARLNGITTSADGTQIYVTFTGKLPGPGNEQGGVLELQAFGG